MKVLVIVLSKTACQLHLCNAAQLTAHLVIEGDSLSMEAFSQECAGFIGFFDWLRPDAHTICGVRMAFFPGSEYYPLFKNAFSYPVFDDYYSSIAISFSECPVRNELCDDKDFTANFIYTTTTEKMAITFPLDHLESTELESLYQYIA